MTDDNNDNRHDDSTDGIGDRLDIGQLCDCVAGGLCRIDTRTATTMHRVHLWWSDPSDPRDQDTIASPAQLDEWITSGVITGAWCPACEDDVVHCPSFTDFLTAQPWDSPDES